MRTMKLAIAFALFMTSVTYESQVITTKTGLDNSWTVSISASNNAFAKALAEEMNNF